MLFAVCVVAPLAGYCHAYSCRAGPSFLVASKVRGNLFEESLAFRAVEMGRKNSKTQWDCGNQAPQRKQ